MRLTPVASCGPALLIVSTLAIGVAYLGMGVAPTQATYRAENAMRAVDLLLGILREEAAVRGTAQPATLKVLVGIDLLTGAQLQLNGVAGYAATQGAASGTWPGNSTLRV